MFCISIIIIIIIIITTIIIIHFRYMIFWANFDFNNNKLHNLQRDNVN